VAVEEKPAGITGMVILQAIGSALLLIFGLGCCFYAPSSLGSRHLAYAFFFSTRLDLYPGSLHSLPE